MRTSIALGNGLDALAGGRGLSSVEASGGTRGRDGSAGRGANPGSHSARCDRARSNGAAPVVSNRTTGRRSKRGIVPRSAASEHAGPAIH